MGYKSVVTCDCCKLRKIEWDRTMAYTSAREFARSRGWKVGKTIGWVCPICVREGKVLYE